MSCGVGAGGSVELCWESSGETAGCEELKSEVAEDWAVSAAGNVKASASAATTV